ncbi:MAG: putative oxidoreductase YcjS [Lentisphaerae bacterium ADurb.BinA184]|nr:MAG: putative oxidoreductase YcjS [Lentisphaerae bacterium ADurb.BinA184]
MAYIPWQTTAPGGGAGPAAEGGGTVCVIGARGIGRHHANWWRLAGIEVKAFAGTSAESNAATAAGLEKLLGFVPRAYTDVPAMLAAELPAFVDVCSPPALHAAHVTAALEAGAHVLCEKPFVYEEGRAHADLLAAARGLVGLAAACGRRLGLCSQYAVAAESCLCGLRKFRPGEALVDCAAELASPARGRGPDALATWIDLGPHLLAALQALASGGKMAAGTLRTDRAGDRLQCTFTLERPDAPPLACRLCTFRTGEGAAHVRRLVLNGVPFDLEGERGADGVYGARIVSPLGEWREEDSMRVLIRRMAAGHPPLDGDAALRNLEWLLAVAASAAGEGGE